MRKNNPYQNKNILVLGLAKSGYYAAKLLVELGATVTINDSKDLTHDADAQELERMGIRIISGGHPTDLLEESFEVLVKNPGIPYDNPIVRKALAKEIPVITEVEVAVSVTKAHVIGVTGTNGKTTTTSMIQELLSIDREKGSAYAIGNIGVPASQMALEVETADDLVIELSSFQLMGTPTIRPEIAVITNITPEHLDYHGSKEAYEQAKLNLIRNQTASDILIYNDDQKHLKELVEQVSKATLLPFSSTRYLKEGISVKEQGIYYKEEKVAEIQDVFIKGQHNLENFLAALGVAKIKHVANNQIKKVMQQFTGVKHRTQFVCEWNERLFYNDSKATNIDATTKALQGFEQPIILLAGGLSRGNDFQALVPSFKEHVRAVVVFGETAELIGEAGKMAGVQEIKQVENMDEAVQAAYRFSEPGDVILLSPAAASWDQYKNYEVRGDKFIEAVENLKKKDNV